MFRAISSLVLLPMSLVLISACDQDPLGLAEKSVVGRYRLLQWEDEKTYFLVDHAVSPLGGEILTGAVVRIGWNPKFIVVERVEDGSPGSGGLFVIDVTTGHESGRLTERQLTADASLAGIRLVSAHEAWQKLRWKPPWSGA